MQSKQHSFISLGVGGFITNDKGQILLIQRTKQPGIWTIPSGYVESDETVYQTLVREIQEETAVNIQCRGIIGIRHSVNAEEKALEKNNLWILIRAEVVETSEASENSSAQPDMNELVAASFFDISIALSLSLSDVTRFLLTSWQVHRFTELPLVENLLKPNYLFFCRL